MAKIKKTLLSIVFSIVILFGWSVFNSNNVNADEKVYEIGTDVTFPPFEFANDQNQYVGIDMDIIRTIAKNEGFKVKIKPVGFNAAVQALDAGQLDGVIAGTTITDERKQKMDFSA
ncbi:MAG: transporter substrate-binding domain-containing protein, partial [Pediococcus pentosaceus]|nr:transporter substrate-binding domain-containing protein [Pediococcus pentosaceus]MCI1286873.1 transporter substrate-binding domain-containing protein [Pediococcus pentosaceus]MCI1296161.1 transporter substrate-binding domain-containing protein [Pediococcus pentosaceus]